jgi:hypothetical protein
MTRGGTRLLAVVAGIVLTVCFLYLSVRSLSVESLWAAMAVTDWRWAFVGIALILAGYGVRLLRWRVMLAAVGARPTVGQTLAPFFGAFALNNILPLRAGDAVRVMGFRRSLKARSSHILATVLVERILDFTTLVLFLALAAAFGSHPFLHENLPLLLAPALIVCPVAALVLGVPYPLFRFIRGVMRTLIRHSPGRALMIRVRRIALRTLIGVVRIRSASLGGLFVASAAAWLLEAGVLVSTVYAVSGAFEPAASVFAISSASLATLVPSAPGYFGPFHFFGSRALASVGLASAEAVLAVSFAHLILWGTITTIGLVVLSLHMVRKRS